MSGRRFARITHTSFIVALLLGSCDGGSEAEPQWIGEMFFAPSVIGLLDDRGDTVLLKIQKTPQETITVSLAVTSGGEGVVEFRQFRYQGLD